MKLKLFATTSALMSAAVISHAQTSAPEQTERTTPPTTTEQQDATPDTATPGQRDAAETPAQRQATAPVGNEMESARELTKRIDDWENADSEEVSLDDVPNQAREAIKTLAGEADVDDKVKRLSKDGQEVYCAKMNREGQDEMKVFVSREGEVKLAKQETSLDELPGVVRQSIEKQAGNQSPESVYRLMADATTVYAAKVKEGDDKIKIIMVTSTGEHIDTKTKNKSEMKDD